MLKRLFPTIAQWPPEKWLGLPIALLWLFGLIAGIGDIIFGDPIIFG
jgi:hypothetical protein